MSEPGGTRVAERAWHAADPQPVLAWLNSGPLGLDQDERTRRRAHHGPNTIAPRKSDPWWKELLESFTEPLQLLLIAVAVLSAVFGELSDALAIGAVIIVVAVVETSTELRAARSIAALSAMSAPTTRLVRPGGAVEVPAADLVPGDVITVESGDVVPADARVLQARGLRVDESSLTGEPHPVGKDERPVPASTDLAERTSMLHAGTAVLAGEARAVVVATGAASQLGVLGTLVATTTEPPTPLQRALTELARAVLIVALAASVLVPMVGVLAGQPWRDMLLAGLTVAFATVPEELPILITVLLAVGGRQLARRGALLRRLRAGETLGAVSTVVTDKTGTLTENQLQLLAVIGDREEVLNTALHTQAPGAVTREPMEIALASAAEHHHLHHTGESVAAFPFDATRKLVSRAWDLDGVRWLAVSGSPEAVLDRCLLDPAHQARIVDTVNAQAGRGLRVIAFADRHLDGTQLTTRGEAEHDLRYVGLVTFADPLRAGVPEAVTALVTAGVDTIVCTGDHPTTAAALAAQAGLHGEVLLGGDVEDLTDTELGARLHHGSVIARATPTTKHRVVQVLQHRHEIVAVTGDGANDAPALAAADVGIALGRRGADLARAAADMVLTDDAYPTVVTAIAKGRNITAQLRRAVAFYLGAKLALVAVLLVALAAGYPTPFQPIHIVLLEVFMDLGASVAFVAEPAAPQAMHHPPRPPGSRFLDRPTLAAIGTVAATLTAAVLGAYLLFAAGGPNTATARTAAVLAWLVGHALIAWTLRTRPTLSWQTNIAFPAWAGVAIATGLLLALTPLGAGIHLTTLGIGPLAVIAALLAAAFAAAIMLRQALHLDRRL